MSASPMSRAFDAPSMTRWLISGWRAVFGIFAACALGPAAASGQAVPGTPAVPAAARFVTIAAGENHTCALTATGAAFCWGSNSYGELGARTEGSCRVDKEAVDCAVRPVAVGGGIHFAALALGRFHTCGLSADSTAYCWGDNTIGQLGADSVPDRCRSGDAGLPCSFMPVPVSGHRRFVGLTAGRYHTCALDASGAVVCWGSAKMGQVGTRGPFDNCAEDMPDQPTWACSRRPDAVAGDLRASSLAAGDSHTCAIGADSTAYCWGEAYRSTAAPVSSRRFAVIAAGGMTTCALTADGTPYCWGVLFLLGDRRIAVREPGTVGTDKEGTMLRFGSVVVGALHRCGLAADGRAFCWGRGNEGQLGTRSVRGPMFSKERFTQDPLAVDVVPVFARLAAGVLHTCGVTPEGAAYCWGENALGQLGDGTTERRSTPTLVVPPAVSERAVAARSP